MSLLLINKSFKAAIYDRRRKMLMLAQAAFYQNSIQLVASVARKDVLSNPFVSPVEAVAHWILAQTLTDEKLTEMISRHTVDDQLAGATGPFIMIGAANEVYAASRGTMVLGGSAYLLKDVASFTNIRSAYAVFIWWPAKTLIFGARKVDIKAYYAP
ncbi:hypothetical protein DFJ77DRAFT_174357 [Powellomyces hirtus]|nr:hypothetical protein DFJ77DRAFT_174357 [Powellomyces hirtus]